MSIHSRLAHELRTAALQRTPVVPITTRHPSLTLDDAYAIQRELRRKDLAEGATIVGYKIGATSDAIRRMFGVDHPDFGYLTDRMVLPDGACVPADLIAPLVEGEIAFRLDAPLRGPDTTAADVLAATGTVIPVLEILDSRITDWAIKLVDTVADNASSAAVVLGTPVSPKGVDLADEEMVLTVDGQTHAAQGSAVLGHPAEAVAWLVRVLATYGEGIEAGHIVLAGSWTEAVRITPGSVATASFRTLGSVGLTVPAQGQGLDAGKPN
ncbi:2-keto-4-pentenoate hydratase [Amycolatopsis sp. cmx-4-54]|uniref:2-keto-4-pentenoate hydratase n=1 Tax=Amycolatopsis sp. cmx-4-54 TaxID=2790936 RepID=UPI00397A8DF7